MRRQKTFMQKYSVQLITGGIVLMISAVVIGSFMSIPTPESAPPKVVQVQMIKPPPPPPPPPEEPPPPPEVEEEVDIPEPEPMPDAPDMAEADPSNQLGLDADGSAGSDAFGLAARRGGSSLIGGQKARARGYANFVVKELEKWLLESEDLRRKAYEAPIYVEVLRDGTLAAVRLVNSTGDVELDRLILERLQKLDRLNRRPPDVADGDYFPLRLRLESRA